MCLNHPIKTISTRKVSMWNLLVNNHPEKKMDEMFIGDLKKMIGYMCAAFIKLQNTYKTGNVVLSIQYYINLLEDGLNGSFATLFS